MNTAPAVRVVVVDNASSDGSAAMVAAEFPSVQLIEAGANLGFGRAVNLGARAGGGEAPPWLIASNADIAVEPGAIGALRERAAADSGLGAVAPCLIAPDGSTQHSVHRFPDLWLSVAAVTGIGRLPWIGDRLLIEGHWDPKRPRRVPWAHGAFVLFNRPAFCLLYTSDAADE